ncbi:Uncharacterised protein [Mycolicibacterium vanbaalenii]|uniref:Lipoprotein n=1 Tax=Mycolicibacterium vanbaalenii TaxID=110539 RepID=A0A5S9R3K3_MYCVN|nr:hypothetical protein [Mycolicibacterium vanbaalenii]CAA0126720.1 Uncharacterised protein [Mycolicibacterium vanbaalenii]
MRPTKTAALAAAVLTGCLITAAPAQAEPAPPPSPAPDSSDSSGAPDSSAAAKTTIDTDGSYAVGTEIVPGVYQSAGPIDDGACYWKRTAGDEMVDNALTKKPAFVEILPTDTTFSTSDCQTWQLTNAPMPPQPGPGDLLGQLTGLVGSGFFSGGPR